MSLYQKTAHELNELLATKQISSVELTNDLLARMDAVENSVQAYVTETRELALAQAQAVDARIANGETVPFLPLSKIISVRKASKRLVRPKCSRTSFRRTMQRLWKNSTQSALLCSVK